MSAAAIWDDEKFLARFWAKVSKAGPDECWLWAGWAVRGRGMTSLGGKSHVAPRISKIIAERKWPQEGLSACHTCDEPGCVNPVHIWWGTAAENNRDASAKGRYVGRKHKPATHCRNGHELTPEATRADARGSRVCRLCAAERQKRWLASRPAGSIPIAGER
jgi:hypothetical protein